MKKKNPTKKINLIDYISTSKSFCGRQVIINKSIFHTKIFKVYHTECDRVQTVLIAFAIHHQNENQPVLLLSIIASKTLKTHKRMLYIIVNNTFTNFGWIISTTFICQNWSYHLHQIKITKFNDYKSDAILFNLGVGFIHNLNYNLLKISFSNRSCILVFNG